MATPADRNDITAIVRSRDPARYFATLFAPADQRAALMTLYALRSELAVIPDLVSEPGLGEIRLKWWSESLNALEKSRAETPLLQALKPLIDAGKLPVSPLVAMAEAFQFDLYADPPPASNDLDGYLGETQSLPFHLAAGLLLGSADPPTSELAGHAGVAYGAAQRLAVLALDKRAGRTFVPGDILSRHNLDGASIYAAEPAALGPVVLDLSAGARSHLNAARTAWVGLPLEIRKTVAPAFLPLAIVGPLLKRIERNAATLADGPVRLTSLKMLSAITRAALLRAF